MKKSKNNILSQNPREYVDKQGIEFIAKKMKTLENVLVNSIYNTNTTTYDFFSDSISEGMNSANPLNFANGIRSHAEGIGTKTTNIAEHAEGKFNKSNEHTQHSVGIGKSRDERLNAIEILDDGQVFIKDIGGYDGTNPNESLSVQSVISLLMNKITELENKN